MWEKQFLTSLARHCNITQAAKDAGKTPYKAQSVEVDCPLCGWMVAASDTEALQDELADHYDERHTG